MANVGRASVRVCAILLAAATLLSCASVVGVGQRAIRMSVLQTVQLPAEEVLRTPAGDAPAEDASVASGASAGAWFNISVILEWQMVSFPLVTTNTSLPQVLEDQAGGVVWWDRLMWWDPIDPIDHWKQYNRGWPDYMNDLRNVDNKMGVWMHVTNLGDGVLTIGGPEFSNPVPTSIMLRCGWNMVGFPSFVTNYTVMYLKTDCPTVVIVEHEGVVLPNSYIMRAGEGYWVYTVADTSWSIY